MLTRLARSPLASVRLAWMLSLFLLCLAAGFESPSGRLLLAAHFGAFLLWQPVVPGSERLSLGSALALLTVLCALQWWLSWWMLALWCGMLAALTAAQVQRGQPLAERLPELLGFAWLAGTLMALLVPASLPVTPEARILWAQVPGWLGMPLFPLIALLEWRARPRAVPDLALAAVVLLALAAIALGAISLMFLGQLSYPAALLRAGAAVCVVLALLGWLWNPRLGFAGLALILSRRALRAALPLEAWLNELARDAGPGERPEQLLARAAVGLARFPGIRGVAWQDRVSGCKGQAGLVANAAPVFEHCELVLQIDAGPHDSALVWRHDLLARVLGEFVQARRQARDLAEFEYLRAIHETGVRLTHDAKNLLQSLDTVVWAAQQPQARSAAGLEQLLGRQLPLISQRLREVLTHLRSAVPAPQPPRPLQAWWAASAQRWREAGVVFDPLPQAELETELVPSVFDRFVDNCLANALAKRASQPALQIRVELGRAEQGLWIAVQDDGEAIAPALAARLCREQVPSASGLGLGLLLLAREAAEAGWQLQLAENRLGCVRFLLSVQR